VLFPVRLVTYEAMQSWEYIHSSGKDLVEEIWQYFIPDFSKWKEHDSYQAALGTLVSDLKAGRQRNVTEPQILRLRRQSRLRSG
jgi:hypothetical protein